jgi:hypothetical protein
MTNRTKGLLCLSPFAIGLVYSAGWLAVNEPGPFLVMLAVFAAVALLTAGISYLTLSAVDKPVKRRPAGPYSALMAELIKDPEIQKLINKSDL